MTEIQGPGIIYFTRTVFARHSEWDYVDVVQKYKITNICLEFLSKILSQDRRHISNPLMVLLFDFCLHSCLQDSTVVKGFVDTLQITNRVMQKALENEINWESPEALLMTDNTKLLLLCMLLLLKYTKMQRPPGAVKKKNVLTTICDKGTVRTVAGYMNHPIDVAVQKLAVRVLQNLAMVKKK